VLVVKSLGKVFKVNRVYSWTMSTKSEAYHNGGDDEIPTHGEDSVGLTTFCGGGGQASPEELCGLCKFRDNDSHCDLCGTSAELSEKEASVVEKLLASVKGSPDYDAKAGEIPEHVQRDMRNIGWA